ncbi:phosphopantetheine-binding protein [Streptomyces roseochromogenus]|uniref:Carrier domain-containing protein n=1 Tax=Streptomyces roseochromogenus subsp. oscitans DS 12.976 TaxID=1352936 RepID=V6KPX9_STRRC|nr:phosphopantetheine-binding protein [Streptomyces roseochromogenus]EST34210.1 hypothetical protein M878_11250 [Streptomyces roseochromogenus subsp. oscitans DS 12.976]
MTKARELVGLCIANPELLDGLEEGADLRDAGLNSGEFVLIALRIEEEIDRPLEDEEMDTLSTLADIEAILSAAPSAQGQG